MEKPRTTPAHSAAGPSPAQNSDDFASRLDRAIDSQGIPLARLSTLLGEQGVPCSASTLSLWRNGRTRPKRAGALRTIAVLETILGTEPGHLVEAPREAGPGSARWWSTSTDAPPASSVSCAGEVVEEFGLAEPRGLRCLSVAAIEEYDELRRYVCTHVSVVVQSAADLCEQAIASAARSHGDAQAGAMRRIEPGIGARLGRVRELPEHGETVCELIFDMPLRRGEITAFDYTVTSDAGREETGPGWHSHLMAAHQPVAQFTVGVRFHPDALPTEVRGTVVTGRPDGAGDLDDQPITVHGGAAVLSTSYLTSGEAGVRWTWE